MTRHMIIELPCTTSSWHMFTPTHPTTKPPLIASRWWDVLLQCSLYYSKCTRSYDRITGGGGIFTMYVRYYRSRDMRSYEEELHSESYQFWCAAASFISLSLPNYLHQKKTNAKTLRFADPFRGVVSCGDLWSYQPWKSTTSIEAWRGTH